MLQKYNRYIFSLVVLVALVTGMCGASFVFAQGQSHNVAKVGSGASAVPAIAPLVSMHTVDMQNVPAASPGSLNPPPRTMRWPLGINPAVYAQLKAAAAHNTNAPLDPHPYPATATDSPSPNTPLLTGKFAGMANASSICPYWGSCLHPDMALGASPSWVLQGVNESFAVYSTTGSLQPGWPKNYQSFFGVPSPGSCDPRGPYMVDVRAFYDPADGRFWAAMLQDEGTFGYNNCPFKSLYWIAVSQTSNPNGAWNVYAFDMARGTNSAADYTQFGFDSQAIYFSSDMLDPTGNTFRYAEVFAANKAKMEAGSAVTAQGFTQLKVNGILVDSVQPVETEALGSGAPGAELFINTFNINSSRCSSGCKGVVVWAFANPLGTPSLSDVVVSTSTYTMPPNADEPGCTRCIETFDSRIGGTPVYTNGKISFGFETGVNNGTQVVPGIFWAQIKPTLSGGTITGGTVYQSGLISFSGDRAASYSALMPDKNNNLFMVVNTMSSTIDPSSMYTARRSTDALGTFEKGKFIIQSTTPKTRPAYGDFAATSYDGSATNNIWLASEYSGSNGDWATIIAETHF